VADALRPEFLWLGRKRPKGVDLALREPLHRLRQGIRDPGDVFPGVEAHIGQHASEEEVRVGGRIGSGAGTGDGLPLEVADRTDPVSPKQLVAADMHPCEDDDRVPRIHNGYEVRADRQGEVHCAGGQHLREGSLPLLDIVHLGEPLAP
jgi:hypothetical protein